MFEGERVLDLLAVDLVLNCNVIKNIMLTTIVFTITSSSNSGTAICSITSRTNNDSRYCGHDTFYFLSLSP